MPRAQLGDALGGDVEAGDFNAARAKPLGQRHGDWQADIAQAHNCDFPVHAAA